MNEANHESFRVADPSAPADDDELRAIGWNELVARLSAQRELARLFRQSGERRPASFGGLESLTKDLCQQRVNHDGLGNRKDAGGIGASHSNAASSGDRGPQ